MINFFRKIRKKLADDNKPLKYLRYAIGEIVLVVFGILIALSINNWNEQKKSEISEKQFLQGLISDLKRDSVFLSNKINAYNIAIKNNSDYLKRAYEVQSTYEEYVEVVSLINWDSENYITQNTTYTELLNSGRLNIFQNKELKNNIISHYRDYDQASKHILEFNMYSANFLTNIPFGHSSFYTLYKPPEEILKRPEQWGWINDISSERFLFNIESVALYATKHFIFNGYYKDLLEKCNLLMQAINKELMIRFN